MKCLSNLDLFLRSWIIWKRSYIVLRICTEVCKMQGRCLTPELCMWFILLSQKPIASLWLFLHSITCINIFPFKLIIGFHHFHVTNKNKLHYFTRYISWIFCYLIYGFGGGTRGGTQWILLTLGSDSGDYMECQG